MHLIKKLLFLQLPEIHQFRIVSRKAAGHDMRSQEFR